MTSHPSHGSQRAGPRARLPFDHRVPAAVIVENGAENARIFAGSNREALLVVPHAEAAGMGIEAKLQISGFQHTAVMVAKERYEDLVSQFGMRRIPLDIEVLSVRRFLTPLQHIQPPDVVGAANSHMIGNKIEDLSQPVPVKGVAEGNEGRFVADLGLKRIMIDNIVPVRAAGSSLQIRRGKTWLTPSRAR